MGLKWFCLFQGFFKTGLHFILFQQLVDRSWVLPSPLEASVFYFVCVFVCMCVVPTISIKNPIISTIFLF